MDQHSRLTPLPRTGDGTPVAEGPEAQGWMDEMRKASEARLDGFQADLGSLLQGEQDSEMQQTMRRNAFQHAFGRQTEEEARERFSYAVAFSLNPRNEYPRREALVAAVEKARADVRREEPGLDEQSRLFEQAVLLKLAQAFSPFEGLASQGVVEDKALTALALDYLYARMPEELLEP